MAITKLNSQAIPADAVQSSDLDYPLTGFSSTGIDDNATSTAITIDSSENVGIGTGSTVSAPLHVGRAASGTYSIFDDGTNGRFTFAAVTGGTNENRIFSTTTGFSAYEDLNIVGDNVLFSTGGPTGVKMKIASNGSVGIGTSDPSGVGGGGDLAVIGSGGARLVLNNTSRNWAIRGDSGVDDLRISARGSSDTTDIDILTMTTSGDMLVGQTSSAGFSGKVIISDGAVGESTFLDICNGSNDNQFLKLGINGNTAMLGFDDNDSFAIGRFTNAGSTTFQDQYLTVLNNGNVGIGTNNPQNTFVVSDSYGNDGIEFRTSLTNDNRIVSYNRGTSAFTRMSLSAADFTFLVGAANNPVVTVQSDAHVRIGGTGAGSLALLGPSTGTEGGQLDLMCAAGLGSYSIDTYSDDMRFLMSPTAGKYQWYCNNNSIIAMTLDASGNLLVGKTSNANTLGGFSVFPSGRTNIHVDNGGSAVTLVGFYNGSGTACGSISGTGTTTTYSTSSDVRLKENITDAPLGKIDALKVRSFDWKADGSHQEYGFVAQELDEVAPYAVYKGETEDDMWGVDYSKLVPMLVKEIQDLKAEVAALKGA